MAGMDAGRTTQLLRRLAAGDAGAGEALLPLVYAELRELAARAMADERTGHTLQPTALVNEAWLRLVASSAPPAVEDRAHFLRLCARAMRHVLVDHARARAAQKRAGSARRVPLDELLSSFEERRLDLLALHEALERLEAVDDALARLVDLRYFAGLTIEETAGALGSSTATVERDWRVARLWLRRELPAP